MKRVLSETNAPQNKKQKVTQNYVCVYCDFEEEKINFAEYKSKSEDMWCISCDRFYCSKCCQVKAEACFSNRQSIKFFPIFYVFKVSLIK